MLAALLLNIPDFSQHATPGRSFGTTWNPDWAEQYGPDAGKKAEKAEREEVRKAVRVFKDANYVPPALESIKEDLHKQPRAKLVDDLMDDEYARYALMVSYYAYLEWKAREERDLETILLLM